MSDVQEESVVSEKSPEEIEAEKKAEYERKRMKAIEKAGKRIAKQRANVAQLETICAGKKADLDKSRGEYNAAAKLLQEEYEELSDLSLGKFPERMFVDNESPTPDQPTGAMVETESGEAWRSVSIDELGLSLAVASKLHESLGGDNGHATIGNIADFTASRKLTDIKGIGKSAAEKIEDALSNFWAKHPQPVAESAEETSAEEAA
jgi:hypothetical protein